MEVPRDYIFDRMEKTLDNKVEQLNNKIEDVRYDLKEDISKVYMDIQEFKKTCAMNMSSYDDRLRELEQSKYKIYAFASSVAAFSGFIVYVIDRIWR